MCAVFDFDRIAESPPSPYYGSSSPQPSSDPHQKAGQRHLLARWDARGAFGKLVHELVFSLANDLRLRPAAVHNDRYLDIAKTLLADSENIVSEATFVLVELISVHRPELTGHELITTLARRRNPPRSRNAMLCSELIHSIEAFWGTNISRYYQFDQQSRDGLRYLLDCAKAWHPFDRITPVANAVLLERHERSIIDHGSSNAPAGIGFGRFSTTADTCPLSVEDLRTLSALAKSDTQRISIERTRHIEDWASDTTGSVEVDGKSLRARLPSMWRTKLVSFDQFGLLRHNADKIQQQSKFYVDTPKSIASSMRRRKRVCTLQVSPITPERNSSPMFVEDSQSHKNARASHSDSAITKEGSHEAKSGFTTQSYEILNSDRNDSSNEISANNGTEHSCENDEHNATALNNNARGGGSSSKDMVLRMSWEDFSAMIDDGLTRPTLHCAYLIDQTFGDIGQYSFKGLMNHMEDYVGNPIVNRAAGPKRPRSICAALDGEDEMPKVDIRMFGRTITRADRPNVSRLDRFQLLAKLCERPRSELEGGARHFDFNLIRTASTRDSVRGHGSGGGWFRCLVGRETCTIFDAGNFASDGLNWLTADSSERYASKRSEEVSLEPGTTLFIPPGVPLLYAFHTEEDSVIEGATLWDEAEIISTLVRLYSDTGDCQ